MCGGWLLLDGLHYSAVGHTDDVHALLRGSEAHAAE